MLLKKLSLSVFVLSLFTIVLTSCSDDDPINEAPVVTTGAYILNSGTWGANNTTLTYYDFTTSNVTNNVYFTQNGRVMGDTGNDMLIYGSKIYYAVAISGKIAVTDKDGVSIGEDIQSVEDGIAQQPRHFAAFEGKVYVTFYDGYLACIDTVSLAIEKKVKVGRDPEQVAVANRKLYVANSGGMAYPVNYDKTVSVISVDNFSLLKTLEVAPNPIGVKVDDQGDVYVASVDYNGNDGALQKIDSKTDAITVIPGFKYGGKLSPVSNGKMYVIQAAYDENWNAVNSYFVVDTKNEKLLTDQFITDGTTLTAPGCIDVEPVSGNVYIGDSPTYTGNGDLYIFSPAGKLLKKFDAGGVNPVKVCFVEK
ncbi:MAG: hypothetical protein LBJ72_13030 [Dysgonamonadaceae bacterium]|jgi:hypothetical protein|nr:hypothetical protein [Dysgonamonadaceae bacterium]